MPKKLSPVNYSFRLRRRSSTSPSEVFSVSLLVDEVCDAPLQLSRRLRIAGSEVLRRQDARDDDGCGRQRSRSSFDVAANRVPVKNSKECGEANLLRSQIVQKEHGLVRKPVEEWSVSVSGKGDGIDVVAGMVVVSPASLSLSGVSVDPHHCRKVTLSGLLLASEVGKNLDPTTMPEESRPVLRMVDDVLEVVAGEELTESRR